MELEQIIKDIAVGCPQCKGHGYINRNKVCDYCKGKGIVVNEIEKLAEAIRDAGYRRYDAPTIELEQIIEEKIPSYYCELHERKAKAKEIANDIRNIGYHRHEHFCYAPMTPPKRKRIEQIDIDCTSPELVNKVNEISDRLNELEEK